MYADVIIDISYEKLDKTFQYIIPAELENTLSVGMLVKVPFGKADLIREAYVVNITDVPVFDVNRMKSVIEAPDSKVPVEGRLIQLAAWIKHNYGGTMNQALRTVLPVKDSVRGIQKKYIKLKADDNEIKEYITQLESRKNQAARLRLLRALLDDGEMEYELARQKLSVSAAIIKALENRNVIEVHSEQLYRNPIRITAADAARRELNPRQQLIVNSFCEEYDSGIRRTYMIHGVTGSGKTEVYLNMIEHVLNQGRQVIMLIPEIALTYQTVSRFCHRFGAVVSILNSRMSKGERYDQFLRAKNGDIQIMIGPRSALFTPFDNIGLIVIDEEHEGAYKSEVTPRYHARETAIRIAELHKASVVLGSATPSVSSYYKCMKGEYKLFTLPMRVNNNQLPVVHTVDLREELKCGNRSIFSIRLQELLRDRLDRGEQSMLFINKRGYAGFVSCRSCGHVMRCPHCDISLTAHANGKLVCHYCGYETPVVKKCPECGSPYIMGFRAGTEQIEERVKQMFPQAVVLRMDMDTTQGKDGHARILEQFANHEADILVGTQMIVKGHDFPDVTLVGILAADMSLYAGNYMASERTFQLLVQAAGRAGRADKKGEVVIQTYTPEHYSIATAAEQSYTDFYEQEIQYRTMLNYPPVINMLMVKFSSDDEQALHKAVEKLPDAPDNAQLIGPVNASLYKANDIYNKVMYIKSDDYSILTGYSQQIENLAKNDSLYRKVMVQVDFNPLTMS